MQLDNGIVIRHIKVIRSFLQRLLDIATKYAKTVSGGVVAPMLEAALFRHYLFKNKLWPDCRNIYVICKRYFMTKTDD